MQGQSYLYAAGSTAAVLLHRCVLRTHFAMLSSAQQGREHGIATTGRHICRVVSLHLAAAMQGV